MKKQAIVNFLLSIGLVLVSACGGAATQKYTCQTLGGELYAAIRQSFEKKLPASGDVTVTFQSYEKFEQTFLPQCQKTLEPACSQADFAVLQSTLANNFENSAEAVKIIKESTGQACQDALIQLMQTSNSTQNPDNT